MPKPAKKSTKRRSSQSKTARTTPTTVAQLPVVRTEPGKKAKSASKQESVIAMLRSPAGATIAAR